MRIINNGNVGINTTNPQVKLQVNDSGTAAPTSGYGTGFNVARSDGLIGMTMGYTSANNSTYIQGRNFTNTDTQPIAINPLGGNVGIGITIPTAPLEISTTATRVLAINSSHSSGGYLTIKESGTDKFYLGRSQAVLGTAGGYTMYAGSGYGLTFNVNGQGSPAVVINSSGNVGLGTSAPVSQLDVVSSGNARMLIHTDTDGGLAHLMFKTDSQNLDSRMKGAIIFKRDDPGTRGTGSLHLCVNGVNSDVNAGIADSKLSISAAGKVGIGTTVPDAMLEVRTSTSKSNIRASGGHNSNCKVEIGYDNDLISGTSTPKGAYIASGSSGNARLQVFVDNTSLAAEFRGNGDFYSNDGTVHSLSDSRVKKDIADLTDGLAIVKQLKPRTFKFNGKATTLDDNRTRYGFIADEVMTVAPQYVSLETQAIDGVAVDDFKSLSTTKMIPMLVKAIQEQQEVIESLTARITTLEG